VTELEKAGGRLFVRAPVDEILVDRATGKVMGVQLKKKQRGVPVVINAPIVISSAGLRATTKKLLKPEHVSPDTIDKIASLPLCDGHLFAFFGLEGEFHELNLPRKNLWILPGTDLDACNARFKGAGRAHSSTTSASKTSGSLSGVTDEKIGAIDGYHPGAVASFAGTEPPPFTYCGMGFPSTKDPSYNERHPGKTTAAMIAGDVPYEWFQQWEDARIHARGETYKQLKAKIGARLKKILLERYPQLEDKIVYEDYGTPLDVNFYLGRQRGESYGIRMTPAKTKADQTWLRPRIDGTPSGLFFCGQDVNSDGFAPAIFSALLCLATIDGPFFLDKPD